MDRMALIIVNNPSKNVDKEFNYLIPFEYEEILKIGMRVIVPFGNGNKPLEGYVVNIVDVTNATNITDKKFKYITDIVDDDILFDDEMIKMAYFLREKYHCTLNEAFRTIMPSGTSLKENIYLKARPNNIEVKNKKYYNILQNLNMDKFTPLKDVIKLLGNNIARANIFDMERQGLIEVKRNMEQNVSIKTISIYIPSNIDKCMEFINNHPQRLEKQASLLQKIIESGLELSQIEICNKFNCSTSIIKALMDKNLLLKKSKELYRNPFNTEYSYGKFNLTADQVIAIENIMAAYAKGDNISLIQGVTGCGKTEIYLNLIEKFIKDGKSAIVLVPEISLTPQTVERFKGRFGDIVAVLHSKLSDGEKYDEWRRIRKGDVKVAIGARSAIFAPLKNLKIIVIDEEHEYSYKSEITPKYLTREVAEFRVKYNNGLLIMGSATPCIESYYKAVNGVFNLVEIRKRVDDIELPQVKIVDMRNELRDGNKSMFSRDLFDAIEENIEKGNQTILFLNRRGYSTFISCRACGYICKCSNCDVSLTYHIGNDKLSCHYCGIEDVPPKICPKCGSKYIKHFGAGTEKIEEEIKKSFPSARVLRMDMDTTRKKGEHERIYNEFKGNKADILIGTQMISKGMDFKDVTLVGVIAADTSLNLPDFRATERTFQLITQVAGRAGRGDKPGKVIVQTYEPENESIKLASKHDYKSFYKKELEIRRILNNPPFSDILYVLLSSENEAELIKYSRVLKKSFINFDKNPDVVVLGPTQCHISKIKNNFRWHIIFKGNVNNYYEDIYKIISKELTSCTVNFSMDINPFSMI